MPIQIQKNIIARIAIGALLSLCVGVVACATKPQDHRLSRAKSFSGHWYVKWCDKINSNLDCGGFNITLVQEGDRICGDFGGALVNLRQTDEGAIVGTKVGSTAVLAVESMRSRSIVLVRAELVGNTLHWKTVDQIRRGEGDIDVIAIDDVLARKQPSTSFASRGTEAGQTDGIRTQAVSGGC